MQQSKDEKFIDLDDRKNAIMTLKTVKHFCEKQGLFSTPHLNDKLYLQYKGFVKIIPQTLSQYTNLIALWLNNNGITKIVGLNFCINLTSLYLNNNFISKIQGLDELQNLAILNLSHNKIENVEGLENLRKLENINLSKNFIIYSQAIEGLKVCQNLSTIDLSQNQLDCSQDMFEQLIKNKKISCLYLKSTPFARSFKNYRKRFIASLKYLKFLDDRPVLEQDHRICQAWLKGGSEYERLQRQKIVEEKENKSSAIDSKQGNFLDEQLNSTMKIKPEGFIASIKQTSIRIMNIESKEEQQKIIQKYFSNEKEQIEKNKKRIEEEEQRNIIQSSYYQEHQVQQIQSKVNEILGRTKDQYDLEQQRVKLQKRIKSKWKPKYQSLLETLLLKYKFDFSQVQPSFNMIVAGINKKLMKPSVRFEIDELRKIWTQIEIQKRKNGVYEKSL